ncbi:MAG: hypothetical protein O2954_03450, partial [bacterium]|nr:hypothetical protein [bacterium]
IHNLNTYGPYRRLRIIRRDKRRAGERPDGHTLAAGLLQYSSTRADYVRKLRTILRQNKDLLPSPNTDLARQMEQESSLPSQQNQ